MQLNTNRTIKNLVKHKLTPLALAIMLAPTLISAQTLPGTLDSTFGKAGKVTTTGFVAGSIALQTDGKIVAAGGALGSNWGADFALTRYNANGTVDTTFGTGGKVTTDFGSPHDGASSVAIQADGKIVAAGGSEDSNFIADFALARYNSNGTLDTSFGTGGKVVTGFGGVSASAYSIAIQRDGKIVLAGVVNANGGEDFALARYNSNGTLDATFGSGGKLITEFGTAQQGFSFAYAYSLAVQADGKIVAVGNGYINPGYDILMARYNTNGTLDATFGTGGKVTTNLSTNDGVSSVALQSDGKMVVAGWTVGKAFDFALLRYNSNGTLDATFGTGGKVLTDFAGSSDAASSLVIRSDGKIVAAGRTFVSTGYNFALARYNSNGTLDTGFGTGGKVTSDFAGDNDEAGFVLAQPNGKTVVAGYATVTDDVIFAMARYN